MRYLVPAGRALFAAIFILSAPKHFTEGMVAYAAAHGVPFASFLVPLSGILALAGGLSIALGYKTRWGAAALIVFLVPVTLAMHDFWNLADAGEAMTQQIMFMKSLSMLGGAMLLAYFGAGPVSLDEAERRKGGEIPVERRTETRERAGVG